MVRFGLKSISKGLVLTETAEDTLKFSMPSEVMIQAEGEYQKLENAEEIVIKKTERGVKVVFGGD